MIRRRLFVTGIVQGVGFRPFVYGLAAKHALTGFAGNNSSGVFIEIQGPPEAARAFAEELRASPPPLAVIESVSEEEIAARDEDAFAIVESEAQPAASTPISPDIALCADCLRELFDPHDRRFRYPFINCTNCGPRFTIIQDIPYDRRFTTMRAFPMCRACDAEYHDPSNRRFHAQPNACPDCGPQVSFGDLKGDAAVHAAIGALGAGKIVAIKGIGGFHLACDATNDSAVRLLRERKGRGAKPFALMARDLARIQPYAHIAGDEAQLLESKERPIVLLRSREDAQLSPAVAPGNRYLGFLLPYTPLHYLLIGETPLVMTSGNLSDEPIVKDNREALARLAPLADAFLLHNRDIHAVCDDSVTRVFQGRELPIRRSRGYSPMPVHLAGNAPSVLAAGGELKSTFCLTRGDHAYMSQHIGDMENLETLAAFEHAFDHFRALFRAEPAALVCDLHPNYLSTRWAMAYAARNHVPLIRVQHHYAHLASILAERGRGNRTIGVIFDGTGYGTDGAIWGGEILAGDLDSFDRLLHLKYVPLPGGDASVKKPNRMAMAHLWAAGLPWPDGLAASEVEARVLRRQLETNANCVATSSMGRLFDAFAALIGVRRSVTYEAQAAIEMEALAEGGDRGYRFSIDRNTFDPAPVFGMALEDLRARVPAAKMAAAFHWAVAEAIVDCCRAARERSGIATVALSGGVFQNTTLLQLAAGALEGADFEVLTHRHVPPNDGGLALGQAAIGRRQICALQE